MNSQPSPSLLEWCDLWQTLSSPDGLCTQNTQLSALWSLTPFPPWSGSCWAPSALFGGGDHTHTHIIYTTSTFQRNAVQQKLLQSLQSRGVLYDTANIQWPTTAPNCLGTMQTLGDQWCTPPASSCLQLWVRDCNSALSSEMWQSMAFRSASFTSWNWDCGRD